jgi:serine/threonine protein phosphatase PrpC
MVWYGFLGGLGGEKIDDLFLFGYIEIFYQEMIEPTILAFPMQEDQQVYSVSKKSYMTSAIKQLDSKQDSVFTGRVESEIYGSFDWIVLSDGHGSVNGVPSYNFKTQFDSLNFDELVCCVDPIHYIHCRIPDSSYSVSVGATLIIVKIFDWSGSEWGGSEWGGSEGGGGVGRVETFSVGDSGLRIYKNGELVYKNAGHKISNAMEIARLNRQGKKYYVCSSSIPVILGGNHLTMDTSVKTVRFFDKSLDFGLSLTQSIGHHGVTGFEPEVATIEFDGLDKMQVVVGSDGVFDMVCDNIDDDVLLSEFTASEIVDFAERRWKQEWMQCISYEEWSKYDSHPSAKVKAQAAKMKEVLIKPLKNRYEVESILQGSDISNELKYAPSGRPISNLHWYKGDAKYFEYGVTCFPSYDDISCAVWSHK